MPSEVTISPVVEGLAGRCVNWLSRTRPFDAWLQGVDDVEVTTGHGASGEARHRLAELTGECQFRLSTCDTASADHPVLSQLVEWCDRQAVWIHRATTSFRVLHDTVLQACVYLEESGGGVAGPERVDAHLAALASAGHLVPGRHRGTPGHEAITRLAGKHGLTALCGELERTTPVRGTDPVPAPVVPADPQASDAHELTGLLMDALADREKCAPVRRIRHLSGGTAQVERTVERLAGLFGVDTGLVAVRRSGEAASLLGAQAFFRPDDGGGTVFCGPVLTGPAAGQEEAVFALTVAHEVFPGHALHHVSTAPSLRPFAPVLRDARGSEGWAMWAEGLLAAVDEGTAEVVHWFRIKRLLPLAIDVTRGSHGDQAAAELLAGVRAAAPDLFRATPAGHQMLKANRAYGEGYAETVRELGAVTRSADGWRHRAADYLRGAGMRPHRAAAFAQLTSTSQRDRAEEQV